MEANPVKMRPQSFYSAVIENLKLDYCKLKTNFIAKSQLLYVACPLKRERKQKKNQILIFKSIRVRLRECPLAGMCIYRISLEGKMENWKRCL